MNLTIKDTGKVVEGKKLVEITEGDGRKVTYLKDGDSYIEYDESVYAVTLSNPDLKIRELRKHIIKLTKTEAVGLHEIRHNTDDEIQRVIIIWSKTRGKWARSIQRGIKFKESDTVKIAEGMKSLGWI